MVEKSLPRNTSSLVGVLVIGLASIIIGEGIFGKKTFKNWIISVLLGAIVYYLIVVVAIQLGLPSHYQKLLYALLILIVLAVPQLKKLFFKGGNKNVNA